MTTSRTFDLLISYIKRDRHLTLVIKHTMVYSNHWSTHGSQQMQFGFSLIISDIKISHCLKLCFGPVSLSRY